jgi:glycosyltransferase involved in cell wall biosynthesis
MGRAELTPFYQSADLLVLPSSGEGFPLVVQESMACGTPALISADTALGIPGIESTAFVSDIRIEELAKTLGEILGSPDELQARRELVAKYAHRNWDWEACADRYLELFVELVDDDDWPAIKEATSRSPSLRRASAPGAG